MGYRIQTAPPDEQQTTEPGLSVDNTKLDEYAALIGVNKTELPALLKEEPVTVDEGGQEFIKNQIRVWFFYDNKVATVSQVYIMDSNITFSGIKIGEGIDQFKKALGKPTAEDTSSASAYFKYGKLELQISYDPATKKTFAAYLVDPEKINL